MIRLFLLRVKVIVLKELLQAIRDPRMRFLIIFPPLLQLVAFGYAANLDLKNIPTALYDESRTSVSRDLIFRFSSSGYFSITEHVESPRELTRLMDQRKVKAAIHFKPDLAGRIKSGRTGQVQIVVAGTDSNTASLVQAYSSQIIEGYNRDRLKERMEMNPALAIVLPSGARGIVKPRIRIWYNPSLSSRIFYVPGIIAMIIMLVTLTLTSMAIVREKEIGTMEQIMVTPIRPVEFILGKTVPFAIIGFFQVALVTTVGVFWFGVPLRGSLWCLMLGLFIYLLSCLSLGLLVSTAARNQQQSLLITFLILFPAVLLSGFIFPIANMPFIVQLVTYVNPLRYFLVIIRGIFLKGVGLEILWPQFAALLAIGLMVMVLAVRRVGKTLD